MADTRQLKHEGEGSEPEGYDDAGDPAAAFDALRTTVEYLADDLAREMTTIRKGVEYALDQMEQRGAPVDHSGELARMSQELDAISERLANIEQSPLHRHGAEHYARVLERGGEGLVRAAAQQFQIESRDFQRAARQMAEHTRSALTRRQQSVRMWAGVGAGLVFGACLLIFLPAFLPLAGSSHVAAMMMGYDRITAGQAMIQAASPAAARAVSTGGWVYETNRRAIDKCIDDAFRTGREQRCMVVLPVIEMTKARRMQHDKH
jgi:hypothetical protein